ncbi:TIGR02269 family lipoprotein [Hyalangium rubrum]|uniref:TIGR02269 family lipoprotein n=1 Tax=Hyalangium rubrum TaxID=3103134 RepID=A0ABU5HGR5_9BACT|nr:TIGR02269 family lipoprotein [Hyalangium sp. s54d21]MDY7232455.1 TIGR02269 family lipoprotein [Hyalangium sp. s54d21]
MSNPLRGWAWLLLSAVLTACAATPSLLYGEEGGCESSAEAVLFEEVCEENGSLLALCAGEQCGVYRCREVVEHPRVGQVVRTRGVWATRPPRGEAQRYWGSAQSPPGKNQPVFVIPWKAQPALPAGEVQALAEVEAQRCEPYERHHIFPQAEDLKRWFVRKGIDIHQWTLVLKVEEHRRIHRGANGGPWNEAWRRYTRANDGATKQEIELHAGQLIYEFNLYGIVVPYRCQLKRLPSNLLDSD